MSDVKTITDDPTGSDDKGALESDVQRINVIKGGEVLGNQGEARPEHSGQNSGRATPGLVGDLADNVEKELPPSAVEGIKNQ
ncbi:MAG TPA: hypothetical protein VNM92_03335 [Thermoanaerobaculia bacterium]|nr:hypothetical protein [Thermoanaerobaculia bacterium]